MIVFGSGAFNWFPAWWRIGVIGQIYSCFSQDCLTKFNESMLQVSTECILSMYITISVIVQDSQLLGSNTWALNVVLQVNTECMLQVSNDCMLQMSSEYICRSEKWLNVTSE